MPLATTLLLQPLGILAKALLLGLIAHASRLLARFVLHQWVSNLAAPPEKRALALVTRACDAFATDPH